MLKERFENSFQFLAGYFHEDFVEEFGGPEEAVQAFIADSDVALQEKVVRELRQLLAEASDRELEEAVFELGCHYRPLEQDGEMAIWLEQVVVGIERSSR
jgi:hypothetical protein